jgi:predicted RNA-binding Zn ribbon-like protein
VAEERPPLVGGDVVLDLVNTVAWRLTLGRRIERIPTAEALLDWLARLRVVDGPVAEAMRTAASADPTAAGTAVERVRRLRENVYRVLLAVIDRRAPADADTHALRAEMVDALAGAELTSVVPLRWAVRPVGLSDLPAVLALEVWRFFQFTDLTRVRQCADQDCGWLFLDASRNASRRWCSSADCGNRARARRHYQRAAGRR